MSRDVSRILTLHDRLARLYADARFVDGRENGPEIRELIAAYWWADFHGGKDRWQRALDIFGREDVGPRVRGIYRADAPRYEPPRAPWTCQVPRTRGKNAGLPCGRSRRTSFRVTDPATGEWRVEGFCSAHESHAAAALAAERHNREAGFPEPTPNTGGLLPCYLPSKDWPDLYAAHSPAWKPPSVGICADDWPVLVKVEAHAQDARARFAVVNGDAEYDDEDVPGVPTLRLV